MKKKMDYFKMEINSMTLPMMSQTLCGTVTKMSPLTLWVVE